MPDITNKTQSYVFIAVGLIWSALQGLSLVNLVDVKTDIREIRQEALAANKEAIKMAERLDAHISNSVRHTP